MLDLPAEQARVLLLLPMLRMLLMLLVLLRITITEQKQTAQTGIKRMWHKSAPSRQACSAHHKPCVTYNCAQQERILHVQLWSIQRLLVQPPPPSGTSATAVASTWQLPTWTPWCSCTRRCRGRGQQLLPAATNYWSRMYKLWVFEFIFLTLSSCTRGLRDDLYILSKVAKQLSYSWTKKLGSLEDSSCIMNNKQKQKWETSVGEH